MRNSSSTAALMESNDVRVAKGKDQARHVSSQIVHFVLFNKICVHRRLSCVFFGELMLCAGRTHFKISANVHPMGVSKVPQNTPNYWDNPMAHPVWTEEEVHGVVKTHVPVASTADTIALGAVKLCRWAFDTVTLYKWGALTEKKVLNRAIFLETVAGVPGMTAGMLRHLRSLRRMVRHTRDADSPPSH